MPESLFDHSPCNLATDFVTVFHYVTGFIEENYKFGHGTRLLSTSDNIASWFLERLSHTCYTNQIIECNIIDASQFSPEPMEKLIDLADMVEAIAQSHFGTCGKQKKLENRIKSFRAKAAQFQPLP